jgi:hypothetical protein
MSKEENRIKILKAKALRKSLVKAAVSEALNKAFAENRQENGEFHQTLTIENVHKLYDVIIVLAEDTALDENYEFLIDAVCNAFEKEKFRFVLDPNEVKRYEDEKQLKQGGLNKGAKEEGPSSMNQNQSINKELLKEDWDSSEGMKSQDMSSEVTMDGNIDTDGQVHLFTDDFPIEFDKKKEAKKKVKRGLAKVKNAIRKAERAELDKNKSYDSDSN